MNTSDAINTFLVPTQYALEVSRRKIMNEMDIASEIFIARHRAINYSDVMKESSANASKQSLISWLNDCTRNNEHVRSGIITLYKQTHPEHFDTGKWMARNVAVYISFVLERLTSKDYVKSKSKVKLFLESIQNDIWFFQASAVACIKLLEDLYHSDSLKSVCAYSLVDQMLTYREQQKSTAKIIGRVGKSGNFSDLDKEELMYINHNAAIKGLQSAMKAVEQHNENALFEQYKRDIQQGLIQARSRYLLSLPSAM